MANYMEYHVMGSVSQIRMKPGCVPSKFECQPDRRKRTSDSNERKYSAKKQRREVVAEAEQELQNKTTTTCSVATEQLELEDPTPGTSAMQESTTKDAPKMVNKSIQVYITNKFRSKAVQTEIKSVDQMTSPSKPFCRSAFTSPFKITSTKPSISTIQKCSKKIGFQADSDSDISYTPSVAHSESPSVTSLKIKSSSDCSELIEDDKKQEASRILAYTLQKIKKNPRSYIGVPNSCYYLIDLIEKKLNIPTHHIIMCLKKIKLNSSFRELSDDFSIDPTYASKIFLKNSASLMRPFLVVLDKDSIRKNLPMAFRHKYYNVTCIIDCLEIEIEKPSKAVNQALSWSEYKKANTIKYLVSCTPNGLINYNSPGYGGRITDTLSVESCDFIKCLQPGMRVMADRGFKYVQQYLRKQGVNLVRPPSVATGTKLSKHEARETKQIASLRIHVERVIRRLREFCLLKPHACVNVNLVKLLDDVITIACGLINLQDSLIK
ncbi:uncharacterized protein LOC126972657 [Leptidea sinapis]|uniref:uncharacterized protein LOC126972657 n=1 Tax=Leptidea sinapis TaxID=189913 RepID=UPI0021C430D8|nr:uncharacterized protein LOC126972657 [Leptidea sinapis]